MSYYSTDRFWRNALSTPPGIRIGARLRSHRKSLKRTQKEVAEAVGISTAYLNLIENNRRPVGAVLLEKLTNALELNGIALTDGSDQRLAEELEFIRRDQSLRQEASNNAEKDAPPLLDPAELVDLARGWSELIVDQNRSVQRLDQLNRTLADRFNEDPEMAQLAHRMLTKITSIRTFAEILQEQQDIPRDQRDRFTKIISEQSVDLGETTRGLIQLFETRMEQPAAYSAREEVENLLIDRGNHFPTLELGAGDLREALGFSPTDIPRANKLEEILVQRGLDFVPKPDWSRATARFQLAKRLCDQHLAHSFEDIVSRANFRLPGTTERAKHALSNYAAGAFLYPYEPFLAAAEDLRYDIDMLADAFGGGFEQIAHRLVTLRRPGRAGVGFGFMRVDPAGHVSKRFNLPGLSMPRVGGACPLWVVYEAFATPARTLTQLVEMPSGARYLLIAKSLEKRTRAFLKPNGRFSVMLCCDWASAAETIYGDLYRDAEELAVPVGQSCPLCPRADCPQRAEDSLIR